MESDRPRISRSCTLEHLKLGGKKLGADRVAGNAVDPVREFAEQVIIDIGHIASQRAKEFGRKTLKREDVEKSIIKFKNYVKVGKSTLE